MLIKNYQYFVMIQIKFTMTSAIQRHTAGHPRASASYSDSCIPDSLSSSLASSRVFRSSMSAAGGGTSWQTTSSPAISRRVPECGGVRPSAAGGAEGRGPLRSRHSAIFPSMSSVLRLEPLRQLLVAVFSAQRGLLTVCTLDCADSF